MAMQMWLTRPREFELLDQAINNACCEGNLDALQRWLEILEAVVTGQATQGIGLDTGVFPAPATAAPTGHDHFYNHWVGDYAGGVPPDYWPYAWGKPGDPPDQRLMIDRLVSFGLTWSIRKVMEARRRFESPEADESDRPRCSPCRTHTTVWVCFEISDSDKQRAAAELGFRKSLFPVGILETRDSVTLVIKTPRPVGLTGGVCDPGKDVSGGAEPLYKEPVLVTDAFTINDLPPRWTQPTSTAQSVLNAGTLHEVADQPLPPHGHMPNGTYPDDVDVNMCKFVRVPSEHEIKALIRAAARRDAPEHLDLSEGLIDRLRITIDDE